MVVAIKGLLNIIGVAIQGVFIIVITLGVLVTTSCTPEENPCFECEVTDTLDRHGELVANCWQIECINQ